MPRTSFLPLIAICLLLAVAQSASALIMGGTGNEPIRDPGWPKGTAEIFNDRSRIAFWEGPPLGGGEHHAEYRGKPEAVNAILAKFAQMEAKTKRLIVHNGTGRSVLIHPPKDASQQDESRIDWELIVWEVKHWKDHRARDFGSTPDRLGPSEPIAVMHLYTANVPWNLVVVPSGIEVVDDRLEAHGFTAKDGTVIGGQVTDIVTHKPLSATVELERAESQSQIKGLKGDPLLAETQTDPQGRWVLKHVPAEWCRVIVRSEGYAPRVAGYVRLKAEPNWQSFDTSLAQSASITGKVVDESGQPLAGIRVSISDIQLIPENHYRNPSDRTWRTLSDSQGHFKIDEIPAGPVSLLVMKEGYSRIGSLARISAPQKDLEIRMGLSAILRVTVEFADKERPKDYIVALEPEGGNKVGSFGGSASINLSNQFEFKNVPPGRYTVKGRPNPGAATQTSDIVTLELKGGQFKEVILNAK